ncbi:uncharacterized protein J3R85_015817 [Psidium guajava]|nr:uncharacterized protein J3R85_015817 [Psidium guajava]
MASNKAIVLSLSLALVFFAALGSTEARKSGILKASPAPASITEEINPISPGHSPITELPLPPRQGQVEAFSLTSPNHSPGVGHGLPPRATLKL